MDRLRGTDAIFRKSKAYERHVVMLNLVPIKEIIPDDNKTALKQHENDFVVKIINTNSAIQFIDYITVIMHF